MEFVLDSQRYKLYQNELLWKIKKLFKKYIDIKINLLKIYFKSEILAKKKLETEKIYINKLNEMKLKSIKIACKNKILLKNELKIKKELKIKEIYINQLSNQNNYFKKVINESKICQKKYKNICKYLLKINNSNLSDEVCSICLCNLENNVFTLPCKHSFHFDCYLNIQNNICPLCRKDNNFIDDIY